MVLATASRRLEIQEPQAQEVMREDPQAGDGVACHGIGASLSERSSKPNIENVII
jgi:hypothetical protein